MCKWINIAISTSDVKIEEMAFGFLNELLVIKGNNCNIQSTGEFIHAVKEGGRTAADGWEELQQWSNFAQFLLLHKWMAMTNFAS